jgi:trans-aconitate 2-methyltransferase
VRSILISLFLSLAFPIALYSENNAPGTKWNAELYNKHAKLQEGRTKAFFESHKFRGDEDVLDLGSGDGKITAKIADLVRNGTVVGIDLSHDMVNFAKQTFEDSAHPNLTFKQVSASQFELDKKFDLIVSFNTLHWVPDQNGVVRQAAKHLKPGGKIYFLFSTRYEVTPYEQTMKKIATSPTWRMYFDAYYRGILSHGVDAYFDRLLANNFKIHRVTLRSGNSVFASEADFFNWQRSGMPEMHAIPENLHDSFLVDFRDEFIKLGTMDEEGLIHWPHYVIEINATKQ